jgi:hypothetical protein
VVNKLLFKFFYGALNLFTFWRSKIQNFIKIEFYSLIHKKMKKRILILAAFTFLLGMSLMNSCKKEDNDTTDTATLNQEQASDGEAVSASSDAVDDDVETIMSQTSLKSTAGAISSCMHVSVDSSQMANKKLTVTFNGTNCAGTRTRSGQIEITLTQGTKWADVGAVLTVKYINVKIVKNANQKYIILNGTKTHTNVTGGLVKNLADGGSIVRKIESSDMKITFTDGTQRSWNIARQRTFSKVSGILQIKIEGFGEADGKTNLVEWGANRRNATFYTQISTPIIMSEECDYQPSSGVKIHYVGVRTITTTLGTDVNGTPVTSGCADYYKISWEGVGAAKTVILAY